MSFNQLQQAVAKQFKAMTRTTLFRVEVESDLLWETYLASFPEGTNPIYKTRREYDCSSCRHFVKTLGGVVTIVAGKIITIWDGETQGFHRQVSAAMSALVSQKPIQNVFLHSEPTVGTANTRQLMEDRSVKTWEHFFANLPREVILRGEEIGPRLAECRAAHDVALRGLTEIGMDSIDVALELIAQNSLYRGEEHSPALASFRRLKESFCRMGADTERDLFAWSNIGTPGARIRNTVIGTLLVDLASGVDLEDAVKSFETKVAPSNYKRPTALVTKTMIANAQKVVTELGIETALQRRYATIEDITVNNVLFADRSAKKDMGVFDEIAARCAVNPKSLDKVEEVSINDFLTKILPKAESLEAMVENRLTGNLVSLIAPANPTARQMFKWPNNFSWSYNGDLADSIKEKVKAAGGNITGYYRASLSWFNYDDLDLHLVEPGGREIYYGSRLSPTGGNLDVDMNAGGGQTRIPVENIAYPVSRSMLPGMYRLYVHNFQPRETVDVGFEVEMEVGGTVHSFSYQKPLKYKDSIDVCTFKYSHSGGVEIIKSLPSTQATKTVWGIPTQTFVKARVVMLSPNHWDETQIGNKHFFFMLDRCANDGKARGFFNEFLNEALTPHRKVLEIVGAKMRTDESDRQLSGLGFSSTQRNHLFCKVNGAFTRTVKIAF